MIRLFGGLGNQMFIYAFAKRMSLKDYPILLDATYFKDSLRNDFINKDTTNVASNIHSGGGGEQDLRLLELMLYNISLPLCFDYESLVKYFYTNDKSLKYRFPLRYIRYATRDKYHKLYCLALKHYKYLHNEDPYDNKIVMMFLDNTLKKCISIWMFSKSCVF
ncbi:hypothetical protein [Helicobacter trogontum]|uniref:hypothetical protein n=1 Tax=Helicobacter trogontum TaxID=50960 RepID=UPI000A888C93|nr:hypothetical protein [Helicobacter trogontum]